MKLMNIDEEVPEIFYVFVGQGCNKASQINYHNYKLTKKIISSGFKNIAIQHELIDSFIKGDIDYTPYLLNKTSFNVPSSHSLSVVNSYTTEYELERYRYNNHKMFPSRFSCVYAFGDIESCELANKMNKNWDLNSEVYDIETGHTVTMDSCVLYEYLIEGILEEIE